MPVHTSSSVLCAYGSSHTDDILEAGLHFDTDPSVAAVQESDSRLRCQFCPMISHMLYHLLTLYSAFASSPNIC